MPKQRATSSTHPSKARFSESRVLLWSPPLPEPNAPTWARDAPVGCNSRPFEETLSTGSGAIDPASERRPSRRRAGLASDHRRGLHDQLPQSGRPQTSPEVDLLACCSVRPPIQPRTACPFLFSWPPLNGLLAIPPGFPKYLLFFSSLFPLRRLPYSHSFTFLQT